VFGSYKERGKVKNTIFAIDPGLKGAIVYWNGDIDNHNKFIKSYTMPAIKAGKYNRIDGGGVCDILNKNTSAHVYIERAQAMPGQGTTSMFNYGMGFGILLGVIQTLGMVYTLVPPQTWHKAILKGVPGDKPKERALFRCKQLFPDVNLLATERSKKPHDGLVDALLILEYGRSRDDGRRV